jgi:hypothetical protein
MVLRREKIHEQAFGKLADAHYLVGQVVNIRSWMFIRLANWPVLRPADGGATEGGGHLMYRIGAPKGGDTR